MDIFDLNPDVLDTTASIIEGYCVRQREIMDGYLGDVSSLSSEWDDDKTMGSMLLEIRQMKSTVESLMDEIRSTYPAFFRQKAEQIRNRPKF